MREIKFKAWDKEKKSFVRFKPQDFYLTGGLDDSFFRIDKASQNFIWLQYTGLKTNGVEVYEGDIIENDGEWWTVSFDESEGRWTCNPIKGGNVELALSELVPNQETWVQGNIYQNPELLK